MAVLKNYPIFYVVLNAKIASKGRAANWVKNAYSEWKNLVEAAENWQYSQKMNKKSKTIKFLKFVIFSLTQN